VDPVWIAVAFVLGFLVKQVGLPPLIGFLVAGFVLNGLGVESDETLELVADMGIYLLLFSIGLKLRVRSLLRPEIWATATIHMAMTVVLFGALVFGLAAAGLSLFAGLDLTACLVIAFAASFSSTVFAVKVLEEKGESDSRHGRIAIGILIVQDLLAVLFLTASAGEAPSPWAFALIGLLLVKPLLFMVLDRSGHGELLVLLGWLLPIAGAALFSGVGLKADLGALIIGVLLSTHPKAEELSKALLSFKDLFLVGFFLTIGLSGLPSAAGIGIAAVFIVVLPIKVGLFYLLLTRFRLRPRTATVTSLTLANYSEFGLIVGAVGAKEGWISAEWLVILAIALSVSFVLASPLNLRAQDLYERVRTRLTRFGTDRLLPEDEEVMPLAAEIAVVGMGRVGTAAYEEFARRSDRDLIALDFDEKVVQRHREAGRNVVFGDATNVDFWERLERRGLIKIVTLAIGSQAAILDIVKRARGWGYDGIIAATARHRDEVEELQAAGVDCALDFRAEAGTGLAERAYEAFEALPDSMQQG
jgi:predicted Kef-type K+ transport protein